MWWEGPVSREEDVAGRPAGRPTNTQMDRGMGRKASEETRGDGKESKQRLTDK